jgi:hypothetical protein
VLFLFFNILQKVGIVVPKTAQILDLKLCEQLNKELHKQQLIVQLIIPDEQPCFDLTLIITQLAFCSIELDFIWLFA